MGGTEDRFQTKADLALRVFVARPEEWAQLHYIAV